MTGLDRWFPRARERRRILQVVRQYFVARDQGWLQPAVAEAAAARLAGGSATPRVAAQAAATVDVARELAEERGLAATEVRSGVARRSRVRVRRASATVTVTAGTALTWNLAAVGESSLSDAYTVRLERSGKEWRVADVSYRPIPPTEATRRRRRVARAVRRGRRPRVEGTVAPMATRRFDRQAAAAYALHWSRSSVLYQGDLLVGDQYNPDYDNARQDNDCTNFASQVMHAGGWPIHDGWANDNPVNWSPDLWGPRGPSKTWSVASWLHDYAGNDKRGEKLRIWPPDEGDDDNLDIWNLRPGDLIFVDWDPNGHWDGAIDHAMVVSGSYTELGFTEPTYSQHTPHRHNLPLSVGMKIATAPPPPVDPGDGMGGQGRVPKYHPVRVKDDFTPD